MGHAHAEEKDEFPVLFWDGECTRIYLSMYVSIIRKISHKAFIIIIILSREEKKKKKRTDDVVVHHQWK